MRCDHNEISNLISTYFWLLDAARYDELGKLFANAEFSTAPDYHPLRNNPSAVAALYSDNLIHYNSDGQRDDGGTGWTHHASQNLVLEIDGDVARSKVSATVFQNHVDVPFRPIAVAVYEDTFERVNGKWRFASRRLSVPVVGDLSRHHRGAAEFV